LLIACIVFAGRPTAGRAFLIVLEEGMMNQMKRSNSGSLSF
jgi:hypothetical protein